MIFTADKYNAKIPQLSAFSFEFKSYYFVFVEKLMSEKSLLVAEQERRVGEMEVARGDILHQLARIQQNIVQVATSFF